MVDFRKIEAFCKVCELQSFSKAGEALFLSQPTVSAHVQNLERELEVQLLDRMGRTVLPTPAGAVLYRFAKQAFSGLEAARAEIRALALEVSGDLLVGSSAIPAHHFLPSVITEFLRLHPKVRPTVLVASSQRILRQVQSGELMAGIVGWGGSSDAELSFTPLMEDEIIVIMPASSPRPEGFIPPEEKGDLPSLPFEQACFMDWILREPTSTTRIAFEDALREAGHDPRILGPRLTVDSSNAAVQYVEAGLGAAVTTRLGAYEALQRGSVLAFRLQGVRAARRFFCVLNARRVPFPAASAFVDHLLALTPGIFDPVLEHTA